MRVILLCPDAAKNRTGMRELFPRQRESREFPALRVFPPLIPLNAINTEEEKRYPLVIEISIALE